jgi:hypothetical protein
MVPIAMDARYLILTVDSEVVKYDFFKENPHN